MWNFLVERFEGGDQPPASAIYRASSPKIPRNIQFFRVREVGELTAQIAIVEGTDYEDLFEKYGLNNDLYMIYPPSNTLLRLRFTATYNAHHRNVFCSYAINATETTAEWLAVDAAIDALIPKNQILQMQEIDYLPAIRNVTQSIHYNGDVPYPFRDMTCIVPEITVPLSVVSSSIEVTITAANTGQTVTVRYGARKLPFLIEVSSASAIEIYNVSGDDVQLAALTISWSIPNTFARTVTKRSFDTFTVVAFANDFTCPGRRPRAGFEADVAQQAATDIRAFLTMCSRIIQQGEGRVAQAQATNNDICDDLDTQWNILYKTVKDIMARLLRTWSGRVRVVDSGTANMDGARMCYSEKYGSVLVIDVRDPGTRDIRIVRTRILRELARASDPLWGIQPAASIPNSSWKQTWLILVNMATNARPTPWQCTMTYCESCAKYGVCETKDCPSCGWDNRRAC